MYPNIILPILGTVPSFFIALSLALLTSLIFLNKSEKPQHLSQQQHFSNLSLLILIGSFLGARLFHVFYEEPAYYWDQPFKALQFWLGGYVYFGGLLGAVFLGHLYAAVHKWTRNEVLTTYDFLAPAVALGYSIGRIGCFLNGCCYGNSCDAWFSIDNRFPATLMSTAYEGIVFGILLLLKKQSLPPGGLFFIWLPLHSLGRLLMESQRDDFRGPQWGLSISSWISLVLILVSLYYWIKFYSKLNQQSEK